MSGKRAQDLFAPPKAFDSIDHAAWVQAVVRDLKGAPFERLVDAGLVEGVAIQPLYDAEIARSTPGARAIDRGRAAGEPLGVFEAVDVTHASWPEHVRSALDGGATGLYVDFGSHVDAPARARASDAKTWESLVGDGSVDIVIADRVLPEPLPFAELRARCPNARIHHTSDPWATATRDGSTVLAHETAAVAFATVTRDTQDLAEPRVRFLVSTHVYRDAGADLAWEIAIAAATLAQSARALSETAVTADVLARDLLVDTAIGRDIFGEIAKVRAMRAVLANVLASIGATDTRVRILARTAEHVMSRLDPWVNMLRVTDHVFAAACAGVWGVCAAPYDARFGPPSAIGVRTARNTVLIAKDEAHLGRVADPAGGSHYVESLTTDLATVAWKHLVDIEQAGGLAEVLSSGWLLGRIDATWSATEKLIQTRKLSVVGAGDFAVPDDADPRARERGGAPAARARQGGWPVRHHSRPFEWLRERARRLSKAPEIVLVTAGPEFEWNARAQFAEDFARAGGFSARRIAYSSDGAFDAALGGAKIVCLVAKDDRYEEFASAATATARKLGAIRVLCAGRPGAVGDAGARIDDHIHLGADVVGKLEALLSVWEKEVAP